ncbi:periplasmic heavy metal sensor [Pseudoroseicyclus aestuarii]|uniref:Putative membrane protein n=1 Tax=Pseudoroseicyclus aestuarii TaxID=1795041 RepID=A0A318SZN2_9RHOB|nr:periplasmic heavy metal sensor [Pseudoroseicyclus aestuarii]PYE85886.1 putative membrane protein [Pseudoroseicyclus aestuarii]
MAQPPTPPRRFRWLLIASLALNLAVAGLVLGAVLFGPARHGPPRNVDFALGPVVRALGPEVMRDIRETMRADPALRPPGRGERRAFEETLLEALRAEPFVPEALSRQLGAMRQRVTAVQTAAQEAAVAALEALSPEERAEIADRLEREMQEGQGRGPRD